MRGTLSERSAHNAPPLRKRARLAPRASFGLQLCLQQPTAREGRRRKAAGRVRTARAARGSGRTRAHGDARTEKALLRRERLTGERGRKAAGRERSMVSAVRAFGLTQAQGRRGPQPLRMTSEGTTVASEAAPASCKIKLFIYPQIYTIRGVRREAARTHAAGEEQLRHGLRRSAVGAQSWNLLFIRLRVVHKGGHA